MSNQPSARNRGQSISNKSGTTRGSDVDSSKPKSYGPMFEKHLINSGDYPYRFRSSRRERPKPINLDEIKQELKKRRPSVSAMPDREGEVFKCILMPLRE